MIEDGLSENREDEGDEREVWIADIQWFCEDFQRKRIEPVKQERGTTRAAPQATGGRELSGPHSLISDRKCAVDEEEGAQGRWAETTFK